MTISSSNTVSHTLKTRYEKLSADYALLESHFASQEEQLKDKTIALEEAEAKIRWFEEQLKLVQLRQFGKSSETSESLQIGLFDDLALDGCEAPADVETEEIAYTRKKRGGSPRCIDTSALPRETVYHDLSSEEKQCICGCELEKIGEAISEQLEYIPAVVKVIEHRRVKYTCRDCESIKMGAKPEQPLPKALAGATLIADVIIKKYDHHLPLYRQSKILAQEKLIIPDNTLGNWVMGAAEQLAPLGEALWKELGAVNYIQADETPVKLLKPDKKGFMWVYHSPSESNRFVCFEFSLSRGSHVPDNRLLAFKGILQTDGYSGYCNQRIREGVINMGCWDHARRKFAEALKLFKGNKAGHCGELFSLINKLYAIERRYKEATVAERYEARQKEAMPIVDKIFKKAAETNAPPKGPLGKAVTYLLNQQAYLRVYLSHGEINISNCWVENLIRPFAIGRKNWLFVGNEKSAGRSALLYSLIQTCKLNGINPRVYLIAVLKQVHAMRRGEIDPRSLLPQFIDKQLLVETK